jgi:hypothetical protein
MFGLLRAIGSAWPMPVFAFEHVQFLLSGDHDAEGFQQSFWGYNITRSTDGYYFAG